MRLIRCRRGSISLMFGVTAVSLIAFAGLGTEVGTWYFAKRHAQNAADASAMAGALALASSASSDDAVKSGTSFARRDGFATGSSQTVNVAVGSYDPAPPGTYSAGTGLPLQAVKANIEQRQPGLLVGVLSMAGVLDLDEIKIDAHAIAVVQQPGKPCVLALHGAISFQGSPQVNTQACGIASNDPAPGAIDFTGNPDTSKIGTVTTAGGCSGSTSQCGTVHTYSPPMDNPLSKIDAALALPSLLSIKDCKSSKPVSYGTGQCINKNIKVGGSSAIALSGTYFFSGDLTISGDSTWTGEGVTIIMLPGSTLKITGNPTLNLSAQPSVPASQLPPGVPTGLLDGLLWYDPEGGSVDLNGHSTNSFAGAMYFPNAAVQWKGNATKTSTCTELIASSIEFAGNPTFDNTGCANSSIVPKTQVIVMVQ
jgi:hypothetical protein